MKLRNIGSVAVLLLFAGGCEAIFTDLREPLDMVDGGRDADLDAGPDARPDAGPDTGPDAEPDTGTPDTGDATTLSGPFMGQSGYNATGTATLSATELVISDDFSVDRGPGLILVVSPRENLAPMDPEVDINLGVLPSLTGGATFPLELSELPERAYVHIYCEPFGVAFGRAALSRTE